MKKGVDSLRGGQADPSHCPQFLHRGGADRLHGAEVPKQRTGAGLSHPVDFGQLGADAPFRPLLPMEGDGIAVDLLLDRRDQRKGRTLGGDGDFAPSSAMARVRWC